MRHTLYVVTTLYVVGILTFLDSFATENAVCRTANVHDGLCDDAQWSCRSKCGTRQALPCSCDEHCIIYRNCCEDFAEQCADLLRDSAQTWLQYLSVKVACVSNARETLISGCPEDDAFPHSESTDSTPIPYFKITVTESTVSNSKSDQNSKSSDSISALNTETTVATSKNNQNSKTADSISVLNAATTDSNSKTDVLSPVLMSQTHVRSLIQRCTSDDPEFFEDIIPVTDVSTGLQFKNIHCHVCNIQNGTHRKWRGQLTRLHRGDIIHTEYRTLQELLLLLKKSFLSVLWTSPTNSVNRPCIKQERNPCDVCPNSVKQKMCQAFNSYVEIRDSETYRIYQNRLCASCDEINVNSSCHVPTTRRMFFTERFPFSTVMDFDEAENSWKFKSTPKQFKWTEMHCDYNNASSCKITACDKFIPFINGSCHTNMNFFILLYFTKLDNREAPNFNYKTFIINSVSQITSYYNSTFAWEITDRSKQAEGWDLVMELKTYYRYSFDLYNSKVLDSTSRDLVDNLTQQLKRKSFHGSMSFCVKHKRVLSTGPLTCMSSNMYNLHMIMECGIASANTTNVYITVHLLILVAIMVAGSITF